MRSQNLCACGREATDIVGVASDDGMLLIPVCAECGDDPTAGQQGELFDALRRPLTAMPPRDDDAQQQLCLPNVADDEEGAA